MSMKIENVEVMGWEGAIRGMRNPLNSWAKSDSDFTNGKVNIGPNDLRLMKTLANSKSDSDGKYLRMIYVTCDITAPVVFWAEADTYKVGTVRDSCSLQHKGMSRDYVADDFTLHKAGYQEDIKEEEEDLNTIIRIVNKYRKRYKDTKDYDYFRVMREFMPMGYNYRATWSANYAVLKNIYRQRRHHKLISWHEFCDWIETLPYSELITDEKQDEGGETNNE